MATEEEIRLVRVLIPDVDEEHQIFTDADIERLLLLQDGNTFLAASEALGTLLVELAKTGRLTSVRTDDLQTAEEWTTRAIMSRIADLRGKADQEASDAFQLVFAYPQHPIRPPEATPWSIFHR